MFNKESLVLGIETSCDETGVAVVAGGQRIVSNVVASQIEIHQRFGGVVPEVASRQHILAMTPTLRRALADAGIGIRDLSGVAVTYGPGLAGALLVGVNAAKAIAFGSDLPFSTVEGIINTLRHINDVTAGTGLPKIPPEQIEAIIHRDSLSLLGLD